MNIKLKHIASCENHPNINLIWFGGSMIMIHNDENEELGCFTQGCGYIDGVNGFEEIAENFYNNFNELMESYCGIQY